MDERMERLLAAMEERLERLEHDLAKERAVTQIQNCMGRYAFLHTGGMHTECMDCFAVGDPELSIEIGPSGLFRGPDAAERVYKNGHNACELDRHGCMAEHSLTTPVIEVADDLQTAKAIWISPGHETAEDWASGEFSSDWTWGRYAMDFKCVNGEWKIWHFQMFPTFRCNFYQSWADTEANDRLLEKERIRLGRDKYPSLFPNEEADAPTTFFEEYARDRIMKYWPQPPQPYESFAGTQSMVGAPPEGVAIMPERCYRQLQDGEN